MGEKITEKDLPSFLDMKAKDFIFKKATLMQELDVKREKQSSYFKQYQVSTTYGNNISNILHNLSINVSLSEHLDTEA